MRQKVVFFLLLLLSFQLTAQDSLVTDPPIFVPEPELPVVELQDLDVLFKQKNERTGFQFKTEEKGSFKSIVTISGEEAELEFNNGSAFFPYSTDFKGKLVKFETEFNNGVQKEKTTRLVHISDYGKGVVRSKKIPLWWSIVPPLIAIILALVFKQVIISLFIGILFGALLTNGLRFDPYNIMMGVFSVLDTYIIGALADSDHLSVLVFSILIGGIVAVISRNGGMAGVVLKLSRFATSPKRTQFVTWMLGVAIFFDDYANTLIVGNTMRSVTDKFKISREKLAYIVDSTAAPVSAVAFITTWIGAELGYINDAMEKLNISEGAYSVFINSLAYSFYPILTLIFILFIIFTGRDYGAMYKAEVRARTTGAVAVSWGDDAHEEELEDLDPVPGAPLRWLNGLIPVLVIIFGTLYGLIETGMQSCYAGLLEKGVQLDSYTHSAVWANLGAITPSGGDGFLVKLGTIIGEANSYNALLWASLTSLIVAIILTVSQKIMKLNDAMSTMILGFKTMIPALLILILAWSLATTTDQLATADFLTSALGGSVSPYMLPPIVFILAAVIAFSTGSSWSTMAILYPIAIPLTWAISQGAGLDAAATMPLIYNVVATVIAASVVGDHCSPISDTTILSSLASNCDHILHVRTQLPYALTVGSVSLFFSYASTAYGIPFIVNVLLGAGILFSIVRFVGKKVEA